VEVFAGVSAVQGELFVGDATKEDGGGRLFIYDEVRPSTVRTAEAYDFIVEGSGKSFVPSYGSDHLVD
jgi:hypothetical protein